MIFIIFIDINIVNPVMYKISIGRVHRILIFVHKK